MSKKINIATILPYKENYTFSKAQAAAIWVNDFFKYSIFKKNNIEPIKSINEKLDPNLHQAMMEVEDDTKEPGTIVQEIQKGFMLKERLLRPSLVGVSKKKANEDQKEGKKDEKNQ